MRRIVELSHPVEHGMITYPGLPGPEIGDHLSREGSGATAQAREGSKTAQVVAMLQRKNGATLAEIMQQMSWQKHTVRGFMAGAMKKAGYNIESFKSDKGERSYRINP